MCATQCICRYFPSIIFVPNSLNNSIACACIIIQCSDNGLTDVSSTMTDNLLETDDFFIQVPIFPNPMCSNSNITCVIIRSPTIGGDGNSSHTLSSKESPQLFLFLDKQSCTIISNCLSAWNRELRTNLSHKPLETLTLYEFERKLIYNSHFTQGHPNILLVEFQ